MKEFYATWGGNLPKLLKIEYLFSYHILQETSSATKNAHPSLTFFFFHPKYHNFSVENKQAHRLPWTKLFRETKHMVVTFLSKGNHMMSGGARAVHLSSPLPGQRPSSKNHTALSHRVCVRTSSRAQTGSLTCPEEMPQKIQAIRKTLWQGSKHLNQAETFLLL